MTNETDYKRDLHNLKYNSWNCYKRPVVQYDKNGTRLKQYDSVSEAAKTVGVKVGNISKCCNGKGKSAGGFKWLYADV